MIKIVSDSTCDLSQELIDRYDIHILPLFVYLGDKEYLDGVNITPDELYAWSDEHKTTPRTAAVSIEGAQKAFASLTENGDEVICFCISEAMSTTGNVMRLAAEELGLEDRIHVIDSKNLSTGVGLLVLEAAAMAKEGKTAEEIITHIEAIRPKVRASFVVDTLTYLSRGGRCSSVAAFAGSMLHLHPRIAVQDGKMQAGKKYRGSMNSVLFTYAKEMEESLKNADSNRVFITHSGCSEELIGEIKAYLEGLNTFREICITRAGSVVSSHCGPGTLGVLFIEG